MDIIISPSVVARYPDLAMQFFLVSHIPTYSSVVEMRETEDRITKRVRDAYNALEKWDLVPAAAAYTSFYQSMGLNGRKCSNPFKQAFRFLNKPYESRGKLLDSCMEAEYTTGVSVQIYDYEKLGNKLTVELANRQYRGVGDIEKQGQSKVGELVLLAGERLVHCPSLGNVPEYSLGAETKSSLVRLMKPPGVSLETLRSAADMIWQSLKPTASVHMAAPRTFGKLLPSVW